MYKLAIALLAVGTTLMSGQTPAPQVDRATAYYHYTLGHMYAELAGAFGNRGEYVTRAIENYKAAIKADPKTAMLSEELSELYIQAGRLRDAQNDAEEALKQNPNDISARRLLARILLRQVGDTQRNRVDETMLRRAIEQFQKIAELDSKDAEAWLMLGRLHKVAQNSVESEKAYKKVLELDPENEDALSGLALVYADLGNAKEAADLLKKAADKNPTARGLQTLAAAYEQMREFSLAAETLRRALELNPEGADEIRRAMAQDLVFAERYDDALKIYQDMAGQEAGDSQAWLRISQIYRQMRDFKKAREASDKARAIEPNNVEIRYNDVSILEAEGRDMEAIQALKEVLSSTAKRSYNQGERANRVLLLERLGVMQRNANLTSDSIDSFKQAVELDPGQGVRVAAEMIETYRNGKELAKAEQEADAAVKKYGTDRTLKFMRSSILADMGKVDAAASEVKKLLDGKEDRDTYLALAQVYEKGKKWDEMARALDEAEKRSNTKEEKESIWFQRGAMYEKMKRVDLAEAEFRKVLAGSPENAGALNYLSYMLADRNLRLPEALDYVNKALEKDPFNGAYLDTLGWVYFRMGRFAEAEDNLRKAVVRVPRDPTMLDHLGEVLFKNSKVKEAVTQWESCLKEWQTSAPSEIDQSEIAKVKTKLDNAKVRLAREGGK